MTHVTSTPRCPRASSLGGLIRIAGQLAAGLRLGSFVSETRVHTVRMVLALALALTVTAGANAAPAPAGGWRAGVAREKITPPAGVWMTGYGSRDRPAEGTGQDLWAKVLAVSDPSGQRAVLITLDLCGIPRELSDAVAKAVGDSHGLPRSAVMVNVSHTHCSPFLRGYLNGLRVLPPEGVARSDDYAVTLRAAITRAAHAALDALQPATLAWGEDEAHFGFNRRENPEKDVATLRAAGQLKGPVDPRVPVLAVRSASGELAALLVSYACHNTTLSYFQWHGDYAGSAQLELERLHPGATVLFASGCGGDINPGPRRQVALAEQYGRDLADAAERALARPLQRIEGHLGTAFADLPLRFARIPTAAELEAARTSGEPARVAWAAAAGSELAAKGEAILDYAYPIQAWRLGDLAWLALGGEVVVDYALRVRAEEGRKLWVFGYSNDVMAYIPSERVLREGRYEGDTSMLPYGRPSPWTPGIEEKIVHAARTTLRAAERAAAAAAAR